MARWEVFDGSDGMDLLSSAQAKLLVLVDQVQHLVLMPLAPGRWSQGRAG